MTVGVLIDLSIRVALLLSLAWIAGLLLRRQSASIRALVWTAAFGGAIVLPLSSQIVPEWRIAALQPPARIEPAPAAQSRTAKMPAETPAPSFHQVEAVPVGLSDAPLQSHAASSAPPMEWRSVAPFAAVAFSLFLLLRIAISHIRIARLIRDAQPGGSRWTSLIENVRAERRIHRTVRVRLSDAVSVPAVIGVFRPVLLVPLESEDWSDDLCRAVVLHELAHVARWDALAQVIEQTACAIYWFVPLAWYGARRASTLRERASDDEVIRAGVPAPAYAGRLLELLQGAAGANSHLATVAMASPSRMRERVVAILDPVARREGLTMRTVTTALIAAVCAVTAIAAAAPAPADSLILKPGAMAMPDWRLTLPAPALDALAARVAAGATAPAVTDTGTVAPATQQPSSVLCGSDLDNHQHLTGRSNGRPTLTIKLSGGGCTVDLRSEGRVTFNDDFTDIAAIDNGGFFRLDVTERGGVRRQLEIDSRNGRLERTFRVNGREAPYDEAARRWFAAFLIDLERRTGMGVDVRLPLLLRQGGVSAVLAETGQMSSDYVRNVYYTRLMQAATLSSADTGRVLQQAAQLTKSDHYAHELIRAFAPRGLADAAQRAGVTGLIDSMESDHYIAESVDALLASGRPSGAEMDFLVRVLGRMKSDHYKAQVLTKVLNGATLTADQQAQLATTASRIESDHYASEFLRQLIRARGAAAGVRQSFLESVKTLQSDHYRTETLSALLEQSAVSEGDLLQVVDLAKPMSDHYESETLKKVVRHRAANERVRGAALAAADQLSRHYRDDVRRSAGAQ